MLNPKAPTVQSRDPGTLKLLEVLTQGEQRSQETLNSDLHLFSTNVLPKYVPQGVWGWVGGEALGSCKIAEPRNASNLFPTAQLSNREVIRQGVILVIFPSTYCNQAFEMEP